MTTESARTATRHRVTGETDIHVAWNLDGTGVSTIQTGVPFLDHMLIAFAKHGQFDLTITAHGDYAIDDHHTVEDTGLVLGDVWKEALGDAKGIARFGQAYVPMDDALARVVIDCSGRPYLAWNVDGTGEIPFTLGPGRLGTFDPYLAEEFWRALITRSGITAHIDIIRARNAHHALEAIWKAAALAFHQASRITRPGTIPSTKGVLE